MVLLPRVPKKGNITSPKEFHINFMAISKNLIKGKGGQLMDRLANHFIVWQNSMNTLEKILLGQEIPINCQEFLNIFCERLSCSRPVFEVDMRG